MSCRSSQKTKFTSIGTAEAKFIERKNFLMNVAVVNDLADRLAIYAQAVRSAIAQTTNLGDADTADIYTEISRTVDKDLWFLEAHLQGS